MAKIAGRTFDDEIIEAGFAAMCSDIVRERGRMGGDWVIASVLDNKKIRKFVRYIKFQIWKDDMILLFTQRPIGGPAADSGINKHAKFRDAIALDVD